MNSQCRMITCATRVGSLALATVLLASCATPPTHQVATSAPVIVRETVIVPGTPATGEPVIVRETVIVPTTPEAKKPIKVGNASPFTGPLAYVGEDINQSLTLAAEEINAQGGILGHPVQIVVCDIALSVEQAVACARRLVEQDNVDVIQGMGFSGAVLASLPILQEYEVPLVEASASATKLTEGTGPAGGNLWMFRIGPHDSMMAAAIADYIAEDTKTISFLITNSEQGRGVAATMEALLEERGVQVLSVDYFDTGQPDYRPVLTRIKALEPEAMFITHEAGDASVFIRQYSELGMSGRIYERGSVVSAEFLALIADQPSLGEGILGATQISMTEDPEFAQRYLTRWGELPPAHGLGAYVAMRYVIPVAVEMAIDETGEATPASIRDALEKISIDVPMLGHVEFDEYNQAHPPVSIHQIQDGKIVLVDRVPTE